MKFSFERLSTIKTKNNPVLNAILSNCKINSNGGNKSLMENFISRNNMFQSPIQKRNDYLPIRVQIKNSNTKNNNYKRSYLRLQKKINKIEINKNLNNDLKNYYKSRNFDCCDNMKSPIFIMKNCNYNKVYNININESSNDNKNTNENYNRNKINKQNLLDANSINYTYNKPKTSSVFGNYQSFAKKKNKNNELNNTPESFNLQKHNSNSNICIKNPKFNSFSFDNTKLNQNKNPIESIYIDFSSEKKSNPKNKNKEIYESPCKTNSNLTNQNTPSPISCPLTQKSKIRLTIGTKNYDFDNIQRNTEKINCFDNEFEDNNKNLDININDLVLFENKINNIISVLSVMDTYRNGNIINITEECKEFLVFYFESSLKGKLTQFFNSTSKIIVESSINLNLFCVILCYHLSNINFISSNILLYLQDILNLIKINFFLYVNQLLLKTKDEKINKIFSSNLVKYKLFDLSEEEIVKKIFDNCRTIMTNDLNKIIAIYRKTDNNIFSKDFIKIFNNISVTSEKNLENYFYSKLLYNTEKMQNSSIENLHLMPLLPISKNDKKYSLIISLDKTLIYINEQESNIDNYQFRPGLFSFLSMLKPYYELISYTNNSKDYANQIIHQIEFREKYFDYSLYKENMITEDFNYFENISSIGRDVKNILIIDNNYDKNFESIKENKINICPYFGDRTENDCALFALKKILLLIYQNNYNDLRIAIKDYEKVIKQKVSLEENI